jgi:hypothetical protein
MTTASNRKARSLRLAALAMAPGSLCVGTPASADTRMGADVSAGGSIETNPYLTNGGSTDIAGSLQIDPWLKLSDNISSLDLRGDLSLKRYTKSSNGTDITGTAVLAASHRLSPYFSISGGVNYLTSRNGINLGFANVGPNDPVPPPTTSLPDISLGGTRTTTHSVSANLGLSARLTELDQLGANFTASRSTYNSSAGRDFTYLNGGLNYSRTLSPRIALTASVRYGKSNYINTRAGDGTIITPEVGFNMTLSANMTLGASLGASLSRSTRADGTTVKSTSLSGDARLCRSLRSGAMCLVAARSAQPTALGSINTITSVSVAYDTRLGARDTINFSLGFNSSDDDAALTTGPETSKYYSAGGTWSHSFSRRLSTYVSPSYSRILNSSKSYNSFRLSAGLRFSFGAIS